MKVSRILINLLPFCLAKQCLKISEVFKDKKIISSNLQNALAVNEYIENVKLNPNGCVILANGPSLNESLKDDYVFISDKNKICVNDFVTSDYFEQLKPEFYFYIDPNVCNPNLLESLKVKLDTIYLSLIDKVKWPIVLFLPECARHWNYLEDLPIKNSFIKIFYLNSNVQKISYVRNKFELYKKNIFMIPPYNVLVSCIFMAINLGFKSVYIMGADHSWLEDLFVGNDNILYWSESHFYDKEPEKIKPIYKGGDKNKTYTMGELMTGYSNLYNSYYELQEYAKSLDVKIINMSKKTYIDAFARK